mgnify:FL=1
MIFPIDRVQYSITKNKFYLFEFVMVENIYSLEQMLQQKTNFWANFKKSIDIVHRNKLDLIPKLNNNIAKHIIIYQKDVDDLIIVLFIGQGKYIPHKYTFKKLSNYFRKLNGIDGITSSKGLGVVRSDNEDNFVNAILTELYELDDKYSDDCGLEITKRLLDGDETKGFDIDLFQYISSTREYILYEFLKNETGYISNIKAHPMRYSWTNRKDDNKRKFISLWRAKRYFEGKLYLINYSNDKNEKISISEVIDLSEANGFIEENKYCMSYNIFIAWLKDMHKYTKKHNYYLSDFRHKNYDKDFFAHWKASKKDYGKGFYD